MCPYTLVLLSLRNRHGSCGITSCCLACTIEKEGVSFMASEQLVENSGLENGITRKTGMTLFDVLGSYSTSRLLKSCPWDPQHVPDRGNRRG